MKKYRIITLTLLSLLVTGSGLCADNALKGLWRTARKQISMKQYEQAEKSYAAVLKTLGERPPKKTLAKLWLEIASLHRKMNQPEIALVEIKHAQSLGGNSKKLFIEQARIHRDLGQFKEAEHLYKALYKSIMKRYGRKHRSVAKVYGELAFLYARAGKLKRAKTMLKRGLFINRALKDGKVKAYEKQHEPILLKLSQALSSQNEVVSS